LHHMNYKHETSDVRVEHKLKDRTEHYCYVSCILCEGCAVVD